jgi:hypothetical protein
VKPVAAAFESNQAYLIIYIKLEYITSVIKSFIAIWSPRKIIRMEKVLEGVALNAEKLFLRFIGEDRVSKSISYFAWLWFRGKRSYMKSR